MKACVHLSFERCVGKLCLPAQVPESITGFFYFYKHLCGTMLHMLCPKDSVGCITKQLDDVTVDVCPKCDGVWLEQSEVGNLVRHFMVPQYSSADELLAAWEHEEDRGTTSPKDFWVEAKLTCPHDRAQMQKHYFAGSSVGVDHCLVCKGFWLDGGELQAIASLTKSDPSKEALGIGLARLEGEIAAKRLQSMRPRDPRVPSGASFSSELMLGNVHPALGIGYAVIRYMIDLLAKKY